MRATEEALITLSVLADEVRRKLYGVVRTAGRPLSREEAAEAVGISRRLAAFHLDKLVSAGFLRSHFVRQPVRPARPGRTPKLYERSDAEVAVSVPPRQYDLLAEILLEAVRTGDPEPRTAIRRLARERGLGIGRQERDRLRPGRLGCERALGMVEQILTEHGYDPAADRNGVLLLNCPFHRFAERDRELVCGLNHELIVGVLEGLRATALDAVLAPAEGMCCVAIHPLAPRSGVGHRESAGG